MVLTKDLVPVCRHEPWLGPTTNVANTSLANRTNTYVVDGEPILGLSKLLICAP